VVVGDIQKHPRSDGEFLGPDSAFFEASVIGREMILSMAIGRNRSVIGNPRESKADGRRAVLWQ
jgi:hypothetical protein